MDINQLSKLMADNEISFESSFLRIEKEGCIAEYEPLLSQVVNNIGSFLLYGINNGFKGTLKEDISKLSKISVKICEEKNGKKINKFIQEIEKIQKEGEKLMKNVSTIDVREEVYKYIESYVKGAQTLYNSNMANERKPILQESIIKMGELKSVLMNVVDVSTTKALAFAKDIISGLKSWSSKTAIMMHNSQTVDFLEKAIGVAKEWTKSTTGVIEGGLFKKSNKVTDISEIAFVADEMYMIGLSGSVMEEVNNFSVNLQEYQDAVKNGRFNTEEDEKELKEKSERIVALKKEKQNLVAKYNNGEIDKHDLYLSCKDIDEEVVDIEKDTTDLRATIEKNRHGFRVYNRVFRRLSRLNKVILSYNKEPAMLSYIGQLVDFARISRVLHGTGSPEDIAHVVDINATKNDLNRVMEGRMVELVDALNRSEEENQEVHADVLTEHDKAVIEQEKAKEEEYLKQLLGEPEAKEEQVKEDDLAAILFDEGK